MGYDLHITRKADWSQDFPAITLEEWVAFVRSDPEMRLDGYAEARTDAGAVIRIEGPGLSVWMSHPHHGKGERVWFDWQRRGDVTVKNPDTETRRKMWRIAQGLGAKVQGDEGEIYDADGEVVGDAGPSPQPVPKPWWQFW